MTSTERHQASPGGENTFPVDGPLRQPEDVRAYFAGDELVCLLCGRSMTRLSRHLRSAHDTSVDEYKQRFGLPWSRGLVSESQRQRLAEKLAMQPKRPLPEPGYRGRKRPRQPFEQVLVLRSLERAAPKRPNSKAAHEVFLERVRAGRTPRSVASDPDMPSLSAHYAYRKAHPDFDEQVREAIWHQQRRPGTASAE